MPKVVPHAILFQFQNLMFSRKNGALSRKKVFTVVFIGCPPLFLSRLRFLRLRICVDSHGVDKLRISVTCSFFKGFREVCLRRQRRLLDARSKVFQVPALIAELAAAFCEPGSRHYSAYFFFVWHFADLWRVLAFNWNIQSELFSIFPQNFQKTYFPERPTLFQSDRILLSRATHNIAIFEE